MVSRSSGRAPLGPKCCECRDGLPGLWGPRLGRGWRLCPRKLCGHRIGRASRTIVDNHGRCRRAGLGATTRAHRATYVATTLRASDHTSRPGAMCPGPSGRGGDGNGRFLVMRVLVVSTPGAGHVTPLVPIIGALLAGGDDVVVASGPEAAPIIEKSGARFALAGRSQAECMERLAARTRGNPGEGLAPERILHYFLPRAFAEVGVDEMIDDVLRHGQAFAPDFVLFEAFALAGPLVAELLGVPAVGHMFGPLPPHETVELANDAVSQIWRSYGRDTPGWAGMYRHLTIEICPPMLDTIHVPTGDTLRLRPVPLPIRAREATSRPMVYVTFGTLFNANLDLFRLALAALADERVDVVMTVGRDVDPAELAPFPANARVERFIAQAELLPSCSVVVHHGGAGTMFGALAHGIPQVILPQGADNYEHAAMCEQAGMAITLRPGMVNPGNLAAAVRRAVLDETYARSSRRCAEEIAAMPDAAAVAKTQRTWVQTA